MREILFRAKDADNGEWRYGYYAHFEDIHGVKSDVIYTGYADEHMGSLLPECYDVKHRTVGQYTGLKDMHATRIFENDIIRHHYKNPIENGYTSDKGVVKWDCKECFFYRTSLSGKDKTISVDCIYEVIGNIYDNPELLE